MKFIKPAMWVLIIYIFQNVFFSVITVSNPVPDLFLAFLIAYALRCERFRSVFCMVIICAVLNGTGTGRIFPVTVLLTGISGLVAYKGYSVARFIPRPVMTGVIALASSVVMGLAELFFAKFTVSGYGFWNMVLPTAVYTSIISILIYVILSKTMFKEQDGKYRIIRERN